MQTKLRMVSSALIWMAVFLFGSCFLVFMTLALIAMTMYPDMPAPRFLAPIAVAGMILFVLGFMAHMADIAVNGF